MGRLGKSTLDRRVNGVTGQERLGQRGIEVQARRGAGGSEGLTLAGQRQMA